MPVESRINIADYYLLTSRHFFPAGTNTRAKYILTKSVAFGLDASSGMQGKMPLTSNAGVNIAELGLESTAYSGVLVLPILIGNVNRNNRAWVDGLDFIESIIGDECIYADNNTNKIFRAGGRDYDASAIKKISINCDADSDLTVTVEFSSNVENVFEFIGYVNSTSLPNYDQILDLRLNSLLTELRTARAYDVSIGFQTSANQSDFRVMNSSNIDFNFIIDETPLHGSKKPRPVFNWANYNITGQFNVVDKIKNFQSDEGFVGQYDYDLYSPDYQRFNTINYQSSSSNEFTIDFSDIQSSFNLRFSSAIVNTSVNRSIQNGLLQSRVSFFSYNLK